MGTPGNPNSYNNTGPLGSATNPTTAQGLSRDRENQKFILELPGTLAWVEKTITDGVIVPTSAEIIVLPEGGASTDSLTTIVLTSDGTTTLHEGTLIRLKAANSNTITVVHGAGTNNISTIDGNNVVLDTTWYLELKLINGLWVQQETHAYKTANEANITAAAASTPATTTARGIGRVATGADMVDGATITNGPAFIAAGVDTSVAAAAGKIPVADAAGSLNNWAGARYATCATAAATAAKVADLANFLLVKGARVFVTFTNANTVAGALTLNVNSTGAKPIYNELGAVSASNIASFRAGIPLEFIYDGTNWTYKTWEASGNAISQYFHARDVKPAGTAGGAASANTWQTRDLNTVICNTIGASLSGNQVTVPAGTYRVIARVPGAAVNRFRAALYNVATGAYLILSSNGYSDYSYPTHCYVYIDGVITLLTETKLELRMFCQTAWTTGMGYATNFGLQEQYSELILCRM